MRELFEEWAKSRYNDVSRWPETEEYAWPGQYKNINVEHDWAVWQAAQPKWQPMKTAPKDGTKIIIYFEDGELFHVSWNKTQMAWEDSYSVGGFFVEPDYWMLVPK